MELDISIQLKLIRYKHKESLRTMAKKLNISAAYLSAIENGVRNVPNNFHELICQTYNLTEEEEEFDIKKAIVSCKKNYIINLSILSAEKRKILLAIIENDLTEEQIKQIKQILNQSQQALFFLSPWFY